MVPPFRIAHVEIKTNTTMPTRPYPRKVEKSRASWTSCAGETLGKVLKAGLQSLRSLGICLQLAAAELRKKEAFRCTMPYRTRTTAAYIALVVYITWYTETLSKRFQTFSYMKNQEIRKQRPERPL